jgi:hypothetical protein
MKVQTRRFMLWAIVLLSVLLPTIAYAYTICNHYSDGCTICDFYNARNEYVGYMEWCN